MTGTNHNDLIEPQAVHPAAYVSSSDPGAVGAHKFWVDTSQTNGTVGSPFILRKRNASNTSWDVVGGGGGLKQAVVAASTANVSLASPGATLDGVTLTSGNRILLKNQTTASENGIYDWTGAASALTRSADANTADEFGLGFLIYISQGTSNGASYWFFSQSSTVTLGSTSLTFAKIDGLAQSSTAPALASSGTITTTDVSSARVAPASAVTGVILQAGTIAAQEVLVVNEAAAANTITFAASGTSNVANGTGTVIAGLTSAKFVWDTATSLWYPNAGGFLNPMTATGDMITGGSSGTPQRLAIGSSNQVLTVSGGAPAWVSSTAGAGGSGIPVTGQLSGDVSMGTQNTYFDGPTVTLTAGTWFLTGTITCLSTSAAANFEAKLWDGTTVSSSAQFGTPGANSAATMTLEGTVSPGGSTTYKISVANGTNTTGVIKAATPNNSAGNNAGTLVAIPVFGYSQSSTAPAVATSGTITTSGVTSARVSPSGAVTGVILQAGTFAAQEVIVVNEAVGANTVTFAASGTSNVADGTSDVIAGLTARKFVWDTGTSLWYRAS